MNTTFRLLPAAGTPSALTGIRHMYYRLWYEVYLNNQPVDDHNIIQMNSKVY